MKILVACEESGRVCVAFRNKGHEAYSVDLMRTSGTMPQFHVVGDCLPLLVGNCSFITMDGVIHYVDKWDMLIAFPPCTYLTNCGRDKIIRAGKIINWTRYLKMLDAKELFMRLLHAPIEKICVENPLPLDIARLPICSQIIHPYMFGEPYYKRTCLWLRGLPLLESTDFVQPLSSWIKKDKFDNMKHQSAIERSKTFIGIANAMAEQWG